MNSNKKEGLFLASVFFFSSLLSVSNDLDTLAIRYGTDKSSKEHNYTELYNSYFSKIRHEPIRFLEIGLWFGASALMWEQYFDRASLFFIDVDNNLITSGKQKLSSRSRCFRTNQDNQEELNSFLQESGGNFDIIIDDGGHKMQQQITSFKALFPSLNKNGIYIIEDLHTSFAKSFGGGSNTPGIIEALPDVSTPGPQTTLHFLTELAIDANTPGGYTGEGNPDKCPTSITKNFTYFQQHIKSVHFYNSICFISKR